ncbi:hypothetical protein [Tychonema sp. LEGE 07203]|uniref:hypothetical protein n=1 Tax=Tychonema sp. LEGE 07203 TaxID=1828671 RepID=UPI00187F8BEF|nr:hypothetical protein [Tychonema sp. LEGE 07203]MBE9096400.1 hypothetical protein [Tychonema sp. LEGE 07203]
MVLVGWVEVTNLTFHFAQLTTGWEKHFEFDRTQVLDVLRGFLAEVMQLAVDKGFITAEEKDEFISPAFSGSTDAVVLSK